MTRQRTIAACLVATMAEAAMRPTVRDLMARKVMAEKSLHESSDAEWAEAEAIDRAAQTALMERMADLTGLTRRELRDLGGLIW